MLHNIKPNLFLQQNTIILFSIKSCKNPLCGLARHAPIRKPLMYYNPCSVILKYFYRYLKNGSIPASFRLFSFFSCYNFNANWKMHRWCAWDSNQGPQDSRRRRNHGAMAATHIIKCLRCTSTHLQHPISSTYFR